MVSGPNGKGLLRIFADILSLKENISIVKYLDGLVKKFNEFPFCDKTELANSLYPTNPNDFLGPMRSFLFTDNSTHEKEVDILHKLAEKTRTGLAIPSLGKIVHFQSGGAKVRYIALSNFILQGVIKPYHDVIMKGLRYLKPDCTFHQEKFFSWYDGLSNELKAEIHRIDLSSATDRLPLRIQRRVIGLYFESQEIGDL